MAQALLRVPMCLLCLLYTSAPINGNHDGEGNVDLAWIANKYEEAEKCLFKQGPDNIGGIGNYIINIRENDKIVQSLITVSYTHLMCIRDSTTDSQSVLNARNALSKLFDGKYKQFCSF